MLKVCFVLVFNKIFKTAVLWTNPPLLNYYFYSRCAPSTKRLCLKGRVWGRNIDFGGEFFSFYPPKFKIYPYPGGAVGTPNHLGGGIYPPNKFWVGK